MKIIYASTTPLTKNDKKIYFVDFFYTHAYDVEYWDFSSLCYPGVTFDNVANEPYVVKITSLNQLKELLKDIDNRKTIFFTKLSHKTIEGRIMYILSQYDCRLGVFVRSRPMLTITSPVTTHNILKSIYNKLRNPQQILRSIEARLSFLYKKLHLIKDFEIVIYAGEDAKNTINPEPQYKIPINHWDYDDFLTTDSEPDLEDLEYEKKQYYVFLDNYMPYNPDFIVRNEPLIDAEKYYKALNNFFDQLEKLLSIEVIIAVHPKSKYETSPFDNRVMIQKNTKKLIQYSQGVLTHYSTAANFAVLYNKPVIFIYTDEIASFYQNSYYQWIVYYSKLLSSQCINIENITTINTPIIDRKKYDEFILTYLTSTLSYSKKSEDWLNIFFQKLINEEKDS